MNERQLTEYLATIPELEPPTAVLARWHTALAELPHPVEPRAADPPGRGTPRPRADRSAARRWGRGALMAAAVAASAVLLTHPPSAPVPPPRPLPPSTLSDGDPTRLGELDDPSRLGACLSRRTDRRSALLAARRIAWHDSPAIQLVLSSPTLGRLRVLVVTPDCATLLSDTTRGR